MRPRPTTAALLTVLLAGLAGCSGGPAAEVPASSRTPAAEPTPSNPAPSTGGLETYVALGDSYTAATGVPEADPGDPCQRSSRNYPKLVAAALDLQLTDVSCGAADTTHLAQPQRFAGGSVPPQLDAVSADTDLVTMGLGGNDLGLIGRLIGRCFQLGQQDPSGSPCTDADGPQLRDDVRAIEQRVVDAIEAVRARAPQARVVVVDYPQLVPEEGACELLPLARGDYPLARDVNATLSRMLQSAARTAGAEHVDVLGASAGHDVCSEDPWVNGLDFDAPADPFHPFAEEQEAVAALLRQLLAD